MDLQKSKEQFMTLYIETEEYINGCQKFIDW